jgi:hypothetical protein
MRMMALVKLMTFVVFWFGQQTTTPPKPSNAPAPPARTSNTPTPAPAPPPKPSTPSGPTSSAVVQSYSYGGNTSTRQLETRSAVAGGREVVTQIIEWQGLDGKFQKVREATTETVGIGSKSVQSTQTVYGNTDDGRRVLVQQTKGDQQVLTDGTTRIVQDILDADLNGRLGLSQRQVSDERTISRGVKQTDTSIYRPGLNQPLQEAERLRETERQVSPDVVQTESARLVRTADGQFQTVETKNHEVRKTGTTGKTEEETINRVNANGVLNPFERNVSRQSSTNGTEEIVSEKYTQNPNQATGRLELKERSRTTTTKTPDGGHQMIRELERANPIPNGQLRVVERTVETVRSVGPGQWETQRQVFTLDANGRLVPSITDRGQSTGK